MILYTPLSKEDIYPSDATEHKKRSFVNHGGKMLYVEETDEGNYQLLQLMSTDPQDYLNMTYEPGSIFPKT